MSYAPAPDGEVPSDQFTSHANCIAGDGTENMTKVIQSCIGVLPPLLLAERRRRTTHHAHGTALIQPRGAASRRGWEELTANNRRGRGHLCHGWL